MSRQLFVLPATIDEAETQLLSCCSLTSSSLDVVAKKGNSDRGQAFVVFAEQASATGAMRALVGEEFYGRSLVR